MNKISQTFLFIGATLVLSIILYVSIEGLILFFLNDPRGLGFKAVIAGLTTILLGLVVYLIELTIEMWRLR